MLSNALHFGIVVHANISQCQENMKHLYHKDLDIFLLILEIKNIYFDFFFWQSQIQIFLAMFFSLYFIFSGAIGIAFQ